MKTKVYIYIILLLPILMGGSCEKRLFEFLTNAKLNKKFPVDQTGQFTSVQVVTDGEIRSFLDDLPDDAKVTKVEVNKLGVRIIPKDGNSVTGLSLSCKIKDLQSSKYLFTAEDYPVPLAGVDFPVVGVNNLIADGISKAKRKIENIIMNNEFGNFELIVEGTPRIGGDRLFVDIHIIVDIQIEYEQCIEVWDYLEAGADCSL